MGIIRKSKFGFAPTAAAPSTATVRMVPLTGIDSSQPGVMRPVGSAQTLVNFLPMDGRLIPRSCFSSLNTIRAPGTVGVIGMAELTSANQAFPTIWWSGNTVHGILMSNGSMSRASFVSSFGLGAGSLPTEQAGYQYGQVFMATPNDNALLAAPQTSYDTIHTLYLTSGVPLYSYLTSAPKTKAITVFDNYVVAFNTRSATTNLTRVQWSQRGNPSNWTGEGSGFEDLLGMRGSGVAIRAAPDGQLILWSTHEIWYGLGATYPAQFTFHPLDPKIGCPAPGTIQETEEGFIFLGSDFALRLLPRGGGPSQVIVHNLAAELRRTLDGASAALVFATYDRLLKLYHLFGASVQHRQGFVVNTRTGEAGFMSYGFSPGAGLSPTLSNTTGVGARIESLFIGTSGGTIASTSSLIGTEFGSVVTATFRSDPIATELPGNYKQLTRVDCDYRATSRATVTLKISQDGGNSYGHTAMPLSLVSAPVAGRASSDVYAGGAFPCIELTSTDTGFELHRLDVTLNVGGQR